MTHSPNPTALVLLAEGAEEMEVSICVDVLRRGQVGVTLAGLQGVGAVRCSRGLCVVPDVALDAVLERPYDVVVLPGGLGGSEILAKDARVGQLLRGRYQQGLLSAAICAAPLALLAHAVGAGSVITCHPSVAARLVQHYDVREDRVVSTERLVTSQGPGTSFEFALELLERLKGSELAAAVRQPLLL
jgi:protein DJ-1